jgi:hypothetical protein
MRLLTSSILLSLTFLAASCSKNQYAQVEPDDLYFTHKDRKEAVQGTIVPTSPTITNVEPAQTPTEYQSNEYSNQHSPVFTTPSYGSPTIQQYGQKPYYDSSVNPDYIYEEEYAEADGSSSEYYNDEWAYQQPPVQETPQVNNYYYGLPAGSYYPTSAWIGTSYYTSYNPFRSSYIYRYDPYWDYPYYGWNSPSYYSYNSWCNPYYGSYYGGWNSWYYVGYYGPSYYSNSNSYYSDTYYSDGTKVVTKPRQSRSHVSYEVDKSNLPIKTRRADYVPTSGEESGRVADRSNNTRSRTYQQGTAYTTRRTSSPTYNGNTEGREGNVVRSRNSSTVQYNRNNTPQRSRTVVVPTRTRTTYTTRDNSRDRNSNTYDANRSIVNRSSANRTSTSRYSSRTTNANRSSYGTRSSSGNRSNTSYRSGSSSRTSSGTRSSYSSGRSSSRSYSAPSRSSGSSSRSYTPSRSSSRSSGTRSSGGSSTGRSSSRKN